MRILFPLLFIFASSASFGCSDGLGWKDFSSVSISSGGAGVVSLTRFTDATYAKIDDGITRKEMYQLNGGPVLYRGLASSELAGVSPFFMLDMPIGLVLSHVAHQFKQPCAVTLSETPFSYVLAAGNNLGIGATSVIGNVARMSDTAIVYDLTVIETQERGATIKMSGKIEFSVVGALPADTEISDWVITRATGAFSPKKVIEPGQTLHTIGDLKTLGLFGVKADVPSLDAQSSAPGMAAQSPKLER